MPIPSLKLESVSFAYEGNKALDHLDLELMPGEVHGLVGANGAGKTTLVKVLGGLLPSYAGMIKVKGSPVSLGSPIASIRAGIAIVMQEPEFAWNLSIKENVLLRADTGPYSVRPGDSASYPLILSLFEKFKANPNPGNPAAQLSRHDLQILQLCLALAQTASVLLLDEPTTALTEQDKCTFFELVRDRATQGCSILLISHRIHDVLEMSSTVSVLRDGRKYCVKQTSEVDEDFIVRAMHDLSPERRSENPTAKGKSALRLQNFATRSIPSVSLDLYQGEILGILNDGRNASELFQAIMCLQPVKSGSLHLWNKVVTFYSIHDAIRAGIGFLPGDRHRDGIFPNLTILENMVMTSLSHFSAYGRLNKQKAFIEGSRMARKIRLKYLSLDDAMQTLSGGNQQKVMLARLLISQASILLLEEPTSGMDAISRSELRKSLRQLTAAGLAILISSHDTVELDEICHRYIRLPRQPDLPSLSGQSVEGRSST